MAAVGTLTFSGTISGYAAGEVRSFNSQIALAAAINDTTVVVAFNGFSAIPIPAGASGAIVTPPAANVVALTLKGVTGDTGIPMHLTNPTVLSFAAGATTFGILAASLPAGPITVDFF